MRFRRRGEREDWGMGKRRRRALEAEGAPRQRPCRARRWPGISGRGWLRLGERRACSRVPRLRGRRPPAGEPCSPAPAPLDPTTWPGLGCSWKRSPPSSGRRSARPREPWPWCWPSSWTLIRRSAGRSWPASATPWAGRRRIGPPRSNPWPRRLGPGPVFPCWSSLSPDCGGCPARGRMPSTESWGPSSGPTGRSSPSSSPSSTWCTGTSPRARESPSPPGARAPSPSPAWQGRRRCCCRRWRTADPRRTRTRKQPSAPERRSFPRQAPRGGCAPGTESPWTGWTRRWCGWREPPPPPAGRSWRRRAPWCSRTKPWRSGKPRCSGPLVRMGRSPTLTRGTPCFSKRWMNYGRSSS